MATVRKAVAKTAATKKTAKKTPARKSAAKKATAKKAASRGTAKKAIAKKATAKKTTATKATAKKATPRRPAARRTLIAPNSDKRYVRRDTLGRITESDDVSRSLAADRRYEAENTAKPGHGDKGDQSTDSTGPRFRRKS